jgi:hypothetical protein
MRPCIQNVLCRTVGNRTLAYDKFMFVYTCVRVMNLNDFNSMIKL